MPKDEAYTPGGLVGMLPMTLRDSVSRYLEENACMGTGDLRQSVTIEALQRTEQQDYWIINRKRLSRSEVMELILDMVATGYSIPALLAIPGFPKSRTVMTWISEYKAFSELLEVAEKMRASILAEQAMEIVDATTDPKMAFRDKTRADLRMRMAEVFHSRKYGKKAQVDVVHHDDLSSPEVWSRFSSILTVHAKLIEENTGIKITLPEQEAVVIDVEEMKIDEQEAIGMQGDHTDPDDWGDINFEGNDE